MRRKLMLIASLALVLCCIFALSANAQCEECTDSWLVDIGSEGYLGELSAVNTCSACGTKLAEETIAPLFETLGYSYSEDGGITQHIAVNREALARYEELSGEKLKFGAVTATTNNVSGNPLDESGKPVSDKVIVSDFTNKPYDIFEIVVKEIPTDSYDVGVYCCMFIIANGNVTYIDNCVIKTEVGAHSYNEIAAGLAPESPSTPEEPSGKQNWDDDGSLKILTIGNSFSDDAMEYVYNIAKEAGVKSVELANLRANSCSLAMHLDNATNNNGVYMFRHWADGATTWSDTGTWSGGPYTIKQAVEFADWDYIVFQQVSSDSGNASTYDDLNALLDYVEELNPTAKFAWHMTWSMRADYASYGPAYSAIVDAVEAKIVTNSRIDLIIPAGTAIQNAKTSYLTSVQIQRDAKHLAYGMGRYIAGLTFVKALTGLSIDETSYPLTDTEGHSSTSGNANCQSSFQFTDEINAICIESANNAIDTPLDVTNSEYPTQN